MAKIAYRLEEAAEQCSVGVKRIRRAVRDGELTQVYPDSQPRILHHELEAWTKAEWPETPVEGNDS